MKVISQVVLGGKSNKTLVNIVLTSDELASLYEGKVINGVDDFLHVQIVAYGEGATEG